MIVCSLAQQKPAQESLHLPEKHSLLKTRPLHPWDFPGKSTGVGCHCLGRANLCLVVPAPCGPDLHSQDWKYVLPDDICVLCPPPPGRAMPSFHHSGTRPIQGRQPAGLQEELTDCNFEGHLMHQRLLSLEKFVLFLRKSFSPFSYLLSS